MMAQYVDTGRREGDIESKIVKAAKLRGWRQRKMQFVGRRGCPDRWFQRDPGQLVILEIKDPDGVLSVAQKREIKWLNDVITNNISELAAQMERNNAAIAANELSIQENLDNLGLVSGQVTTNEAHIATTNLRIDENTANDNALTSCSIQ